MKKFLIAAIAATLLSQPATAQDLREAEIVVTGSRMSYERQEFDDYDASRPAVGLIRTADFLVQQVAISGDTRDAAQRMQEIRRMLSEAVQRAGRHGVELAYGDTVLTNLNASNMAELVVTRGSRPDTGIVRFLVKAKLSEEQSGTEAQRKIAAYIEAVPENGRAQMDTLGDPTLSIVGPDSYRLQVTQAIADDAQLLTAQLGDGYAVEIEGLNKPVQWVRSGPSQLLLYIPYRLTVMPRP